MTGAVWPDWMPRFPTLECPVGRPLCEICAADVFDWYQRAKAADPMVTPPRVAGFAGGAGGPFLPDASTLPARLREAFPLPEDECDDGA